MLQMVFVGLDERAHGQQHSICGRVSILLMV